MSGFIECQLNYLMWLQNFRDLTGGFFDSFFLSVTYFGELLIPVSVLCLIYWSLNKETGKFLLVTYSFSLIVNQILKMGACIERPWILNENIKPVKDAIAGATGYSFPSGHTARAVSIWGGLCARFWNNKPLRYFLITLIFLVMFSRNYLGVHTPQDVLVSFLASAVIVIVLFKYFNKSTEKKILAAGIIVTLLTIIFVITKYNYLQGDAFISFMKQMPSFYKNAGYTFGVFSGLLLCNRFIVFTTDNLSIKNRIFRFIPGFIMFVLLLYGTEPVFGQDFGQCKGGFIHRALIAVFITFIYPWMFTRIERKLEATGEKYE